MYFMLYVYTLVGLSIYSPPEGNGVHFMFEVVSRLRFSEESYGADHFLKTGAQHAQHAIVANFEDINKFSMVLKTI